MWVIAVCLRYYTPSKSVNHRSLCIIINRSPAFHSFTKKNSDGDKSWLASVDHSTRATIACDRAWQALLLLLKKYKVFIFQWEIPGLVFCDLNSIKRWKKNLSLCLFLPHRYTIPYNCGMGHWEAVLWQWEVSPFLWLLRFLHIQGESSVFHPPGNKSRTRAKTNCVALRRWMSINNLM